MRAANDQAGKPDQRFYDAVELALDEFRDRSALLRQREQALRNELQSSSEQTTNRAA